MHNNTIAILKNSIFLYLRMFLILAVSLYTSRVILKYLGITDFGIYNVVAGIISFIVFFNNTLMSATQRFINYTLGNINGNTRTVFRASMAVHIALCVILVIVMETVGLWFLNNKIVLPANRFYAAQWVFQTSLIIGILSIIKSPYHAMIIAYERMNIFALFSIVETILKLLIVYVLSISNIDALILYSILMVIVQLIVFLLYYFYCLKNFHSEIYLRGKIDKQILKDIMKFIGWSSYGGIAMLGYTQGLNILLNIFFGPIQNAARAISTQVEGIVNQFRGNFQVAVNPQLVKSYADSNMTYFMKLMSFSCKFTTFIMLAMTVPLCFRVDWLLNLWLVDVPENTSVFLKILLIASLIDSPSVPFVIGIQANGNIKLHEIINGTLLLLILPISYFALWKGFPSASIFIIYAIFMFITFLVRIVIFSKLLNLRLNTLYNMIFKYIIVVCGLSFICGYFINELLSHSILGSLLYYILIFIVELVISYTLGLSSEEKKYAQGVTFKIINKIRNKRKPTN